MLLTRYPCLLGSDDHHFHCPMKSIRFHPFACELMLLQSASHTSVIGKCGNDKSCADDLAETRHCRAYWLHPFVGAFLSSVIASLWWGSPGAHWLHRCRASRDPPRSSPISLPDPKEKEFPKQKKQKKREDSCKTLFLFFFSVMAMSFLGRIASVSLFLVSVMFMVFCSCAGGGVLHSPSLHNRKNS